MESSAHPPQPKEKVYYPDLLSAEDYNFLMGAVHDFRHLERRGVLTDLEVNFAAFILFEMRKKQTLTDKEEDELIEYWNEIENWRFKNSKR